MAFSTGGYKPATACGEHVPSFATNVNELNVAYSSKSIANGSTYTNCETPKSKRIDDHNWGVLSVGVQVRAS
jgi:hypothetical protein